MSLAIVNHETLELLFEHAAKDFLVDFEATLHKKQFFDVALSGGATAKAFFGFLINVLINHKHLSQIRFFFSDERVVGIDSSDSNAGNALNLLLKPLGIDSAQVFPMYDGKNRAEACAREYESLIKKLVENDADGVPVFDLIYLGIGQDGHTASLFPHNELLKDGHGLIRSMKEAGFPYDRITMMPGLINAARRICVMAYGPSKASIINDIINGPELGHALPAQLVLRNTASNVTLMTADLGVGD